MNEQYCECCGDGNEHKRESEGGKERKTTHQESRVITKRRRYMYTQTHTQI